jgi:predicted metal-binding membrane protein
MTPAAIEATSTLERVIRRDRIVLALALAVLTTIAAVYLVRSAAVMQAMSAEASMHAAMGMSMTPTWTADWPGLFLMWAVMMVAMMLPSAAPVILLVLAMYRRRGDRRAVVSAYAFVGGYLLAWTGFSAAAAAAQVALHRAALIGADMRFSRPVLSGIVLIAVGVYQWLPLKNLCLTHCQSPLGILSRYWREGPTGGLVTGMRHGAYCVGCCWLLMAMLFVVGVMNLLWVTALAAFILVEKLVRMGQLVPRIAGAGLAGWGSYLLASALVA